MELDRFGFAGISLNDGERIESMLPMADDGGGRSSEAPEIMVLTDKRVIHLQGSGSHRQALFASLDDIESVEVTFEREGFGAYIWAALAFFVAILLYVVIANTAGRIIAAGIVTLMGVYLIADHATSPGRPFVVFKAGSAHVRRDLKGADASANIYPFINRLFQLKAENAADGFSRASRFAPR